MTILVTGGAGYIGSFMTRILLERGFEVVVLDNLSRGDKKAIDPRAKFVEGDLLKKEDIQNVFSQHSPEAVIHFAGFISMAESMQKPGMYFEGNMYATVNLLDVMAENNVGYIVFSSTAGVYGNPQKIPITENHPKNPENPYGESKYMVEKILSWYYKTHGINYTALRYFNAAGAALDGSIGEAHDPETHIIPNAINALLQNKKFTLFGDDYDTPDGTCIRDYIHVLDLTEAHILALEKMKEDAGEHIYNVGTGEGHSNKEIVEMIEKVSNKKVDVEIYERRPGDASVLVADPTKIKKELGFAPKYSNLSTIVETAWKWHMTQK